MCNVLADIISIIKIVIIVCILLGILIFYFRL